MRRPDQLRDKNAPHIAPHHLVARIDRLQRFGKSGAAISLMAPEEYLLLDKGIAHPAIIIAIAIEVVANPAQDPFGHLLHPRLESNVKRHEARGQIPQMLWPTHQQPIYDGR